MGNFRHAYLIIAHNNFKVLEKLIRAIDDERNDIYIHIDKKTKDISIDHLKNLAKKANSINVYQKINTNWGGYSLPKVELFLLSKATKERHAYYHLLSGADFPLKSQDMIHDFFLQNNGKEFVQVCDVYKDWTNRIKYYWFFQETVGRYNSENLKLKQKLARRVQKVLLNIQKKINVDRIHNQFAVYSGSQWFSITHEAALYVIDNENFIKHHFRYSNCSDELFLPILIGNSKFNDKTASNNNLRHIDWNRGRPYVFKSSDYEELINCDDLFARKFDQNKDLEIIDKLYEHITMRG